MTPISMAAASLFLLILPLIHPAVAEYGLNNVIFTNQILNVNDKLFYKDSVLELQSDCNLVIRSPFGGFNTGIFGGHSYHNCCLLLDYYSRLQIRGLRYTTRGLVEDILWQSRSNYLFGIHAAILRPDGRFTVYGPKVWDSFLFRDSNLQRQHSSQQGNSPISDGFLFSDQILYGNGKLTTKDYNLIMKDDCNLVVEKAGQEPVWQSRTSGKGTDCFARLDHRGRLSILTDDYKTVWTTHSQGLLVVGEYVLTLQVIRNASVCIYGPISWISPHNRDSGMITTAK